MGNSGPTLLLTLVFDMFYLHKYSHGFSVIQFF